MVYFKITDGTVTRKFKIQPGDAASFDSMKERIAVLFPDALKEGSGNFHLHYRDSEGDVITISTDTEFQEVLSELPEDAVWKLHIRELTDTHDLHHLHHHHHQRQPGLPANFFFRPSYVPQRMSRPRFDPFSSDSGFDPTKWLNPFSSDPGFDPTKWLNPFSSDPFHHHHHHHPHPHHYHPHHPASGFDKEFERMVDEHAQLLDTLHNTPSMQEAEETQGEASATDGTDGKGGEVQPKPAEALANLPGAQIKNFGSWTPREFDGPCGKGRVIGPVGYYVSWSSGPADSDKKQGGKKEGGDKKEEGSTPSAADATQEKQSVEGLDTAS